MARLLGRRGFHAAQVRAGVRMVAGRLEAHAWVEYNGCPIGESPVDVATFAPMANVHLSSFR